MFRSSSIRKAGSKGARQQVSKLHDDPSIFLTGAEKDGARMNYFVCESISSVKSIPGPAPWTPVFSLSAGNGLLIRSDGGHGCAELQRRLQHKFVLEFEPHHRLGRNYERMVAGEGSSNRAGAATHEAADQKTHAAMRQATYQHAQSGPTADQPC
jgi:hypothetical protein